jgi:ubiquitin C-terminal hydrolase
MEKVKSITQSFLILINLSSVLYARVLNVISSVKSSHHLNLYHCLYRKTNIYIRVSIPIYSKFAQVSKLKEFKAMKSNNLALRLQDCFAAFSNSEQLDRNNSWKCPHCKNNVEAVKKMEIYRVPNIFIIHLKRFRASGVFREKINAAVAFPRENLDIRDYVLGHDPGLYDLFAVSNHFGTLAGGHYTATVFNSLRGKWFDCNDSTVSETDSISENASYLLFYKAKSFTKVGINI